MKQQQAGVEAWRKRAKLTARQQRWAQRLASVEPGLRLTDLAARLKQPYATVQRWAAFFGYPILDARRDRSARVNWGRVDWRKSNVQLARELGVSRERVRQVRRTAGIAPVESSAHRFYQFVLTRREELLDCSVRQAIEASGIHVCYEVARQALRKAGIEPFKRKDEGHPIDWRLPNRDLARIHGRSEQQIANLRFRRSAGPAKWDLRGGRALKDAGYRAALEKEKQRAARKGILSHEGNASRDGKLLKKNSPKRRI